MDAQLPQHSAASEDEAFITQIAEQRAQLQALSGQRRHRLQELEGEITARMERLAGSLHELQSDATQQRATADQKLDALARQEAALAQRQVELDGREAQLSDLRDTVTRKRSDTVARARRIAARLKGQRGALKEHRAAEYATLERAAAEEVSALRERLEAAGRQRDELAAERQAFVEQLDRARAELESLRAASQVLAAVRDELAHSQAGMHDVEQARGQLAAALAAREEELAARRRELEAQAAAITETQRARDKADQERDALRGQLESAQVDLAQARAALADSDARAQAVAELQARLEQSEQGRLQLEQQIAALGGQLNTANAQVEAGLQQLTELTTAVEAAGKLEQELKSTRDHVQRLESQAAELIAARESLSNQHATLQSRCQELEADLTAARGDGDAELVRLAGKLADVESQAAAVSEELQGTKAALAEARQSATQAGEQARKLESELAATRDQATGGIAAAHAECGQLKEHLQAIEAERDLLHKQCDALRQQLEGAAVSAEGGNAELEDKVHSLEKRYALALEDLRDGKARIAELEEKLAEARRNGGVGAAVAGGDMDWEAQKRRMLAMLEESDGDSEADAAERLTIQGTIEITDAVVADKDRELLELRRLLEEQSNNIGNMAVGASAIAQIVASDEVIQHERERLRHLQGEWEEKMRQAEVEISLERAKVARERAEVEEKVRALEERVAHFGAQAANAPDPGPGKESKRGRWLERLGLKDSHS